MVLLYKQDMNLQLVKRRALPGIFALLFCFCAAAHAQETENKLLNVDQRRIIAVLLENKFKDSAEETIYISTVNIPDDIQKNFPPVKNKNFRLVSPEAAKDTEICAYGFGKFEFIDKFVSVSFGSCREGLAYDFIKDGNGWKSVGLVITREIFY